MTTNTLIEHQHYICKHGEDLPEIRNWKWDAKALSGGKPTPELARV